MCPRTLLERHRSRFGTGMQTAADCRHEKSLFQRRIDRPRQVDLVASDHQWRGERIVVFHGYPGQDASASPALAVSACAAMLPGEARPPESARSRTAWMGWRGMLDKAFVEAVHPDAARRVLIIPSSTSTRNAASATRRRAVAAESRAWLAGFQGSKQRRFGKHRRQWIEGRPEMPCRAASRPPRLPSCGSAISWRVRTIPYGSREDQHRRAPSAELAHL